MVRGSLTILLLVVCVIAACGQTHPPAQAETTKDTLEERPWPAALEGVWEGTSTARKLRADSVEQQWEANIRLELRNAKYQYWGLESDSGHGEYGVNEYTISFVFGTNTRPQNPAFNLEGKYEFFYDDSVLILDQYEAIGPPVKNQAFMEKELVLRRTSK